MERKRYFFMNLFIKIKNNFSSSIRLKLIFINSVLVFIPVLLVIIISYYNSIDSLEESIIVTKEKEIVWARNEMELVPFHTIMVSLFKLCLVLNIMGKLWGLGLIYIGFGVCMATFLYHGFVKSVPLELEEAAIIDGCSDIEVFRSIVFPLLKPISITIAILNILWIWNDFLLPLIILSDLDKYTLVLSINMFVGEYNVDWTYILAGLTMASLPVIIFYITVQKYIIKGITDGAVKG